MRIKRASSLHIADNFASDPNLNANLNELDRTRLYVSSVVRSELRSVGLASLPRVAAHALGDQRDCSRSTRRNLRIQTLAAGFCMPEDPIPSLPSGQAFCLAGQMQRSAIPACSRLRTLHRDVTPAAPTVQRSGLPVASRARCITPRPRNVLSVVRSSICNTVATWSQRVLSCLIDGYNLHINESMAAAGLVPMMA